MMDDPYYSIQHQRRATLKIKRSVFVCTLAPVISIEQAKKMISSISKENKAATHNCWAYILGEKGELYHSSDAGEPAGTAGRPMLNILKTHRMTHVAAVVTRYFGGVKLGIRGLMAAYSDSVKQAIDMEGLQKQVPAACLMIHLSYEVNDTVLNFLKPFQPRILDTVYTEHVIHRVEIEQSCYDRVETFLSEYQSRGKLHFQIISRNGIKGL